MQGNLRRNVYLIYAMAFFYSFILVVPVFVPLVQDHGLSMAQVLQTQALFALTIACLEVPSGYIADIWGRRRAILVGSAFHAAGFAMLPWADGFGDFLIYEALLGVGISLISGADVALLYDSELELEKLGATGAGASKSLSRLISVEAGASGLAGLGASLLLLIGSMQLLIVVQAVCGLVPLALGLLLRETPRPHITQGHAGNASAIVRLMLRGNPVVLWTTLAIIAFGLLGLYSFWIYQKYWEAQGLPVESFGYLWAVFALVISVTARYAEALENYLGWRRLLVVTALLPLVGLAGMALLGGWPGVLFGLALQAGRGLSLSLFYEALNRRIPGDFRATVNSLVSLGTRSVFILSGPLLGWSLDAFGVRPTLLVLLAIFTPVVAMVLLGLGLRIVREAVTGAGAGGAPV
jgi:MFS family permease